MIQGEYGELTDLAQGHRCPEHDNPLTVAWHSGVHEYVIRCGAGHFPDELVDNPSVTELWKRGADLPCPVQDNVEKGQARRQEPDRGDHLLIEVEGIPRTDLSTGEVLEPDKLMDLAVYAVDAGLDPRRGHICMMYGKPYVTLDAYLYHARKSGRRCRLTSRPMHQDERTDLMVADGDHAWLADLEFPETGEVYMGLGIVTAAEMAEMSTRNPNRPRSPVVHGKPWQMANKRCRRDALAQAFPLGIEPEEKEVLNEGNETV